jgi:hypothetical protein
MNQRCRVAVSPTLARWRARCLSIICGHLQRERLAPLRIAPGRLFGPAVLFFNMARFAVLILAGILLATCSTGNVGDYLPQWAGGPPKNLPPRPGTPEYDAFRQKLDAEAARDKSKDQPASKSASEKKDGRPQ